MNILYVYGTLRPNTGEPVAIPGYLYDLGWYPGVELATDGQTGVFYAEQIEVDDSKLDDLDDYEGYDPHDPESSLYLRVPLRKYGIDLDGEIYVYNRSLEGRALIESGDWLEYSEEKFSVKGVSL